MSRDTAVPAASRTRSLVLWLAPTGIGALAAIGILWSLRAVPTECPLIYPAPASCGGDARLGPALVAMIVVVFVYAALVACAVLVVPRWRPLVLGLLSGALALTFLIGVVAVLASGGSYPVSYPID